jgi:hypothetical protein
MDPVPRVEHNIDLQRDSDSRTVGEPASGYAFTDGPKMQQALRDALMDQASGARPPG